MNYYKKIIAYYHPKMSANWNDNNFSKSPSKPKLFMLKCLNGDISEHISINNVFKPFTKKDFCLAHTKEYVDAFFNGKKPKCESNGLKWSEQLAMSVKFTNASLFHAIKGSIDHPEHIHLSPTSGFHHAMPNSGRGFCTFSGQVIAAIKIYNTYKLSGAFIDLDGHFGNSIEDSREYCPKLNKAIPVGFNVNPEGKHLKYIESLSAGLKSLEEALLNNKIHYVVYCHGADSHEDDDMGNQLNTKEWLYCTKLVTEMILKVNKRLKKRIPFTYCLFGGYRSDNFNKVIDLHCLDFEDCVYQLTEDE